MVYYLSIWIHSTDSKPPSLDMVYLIRIVKLFVRSVENIRNIYTYSATPGKKQCWGTLVKHKDQCWGIWTSLLPKMEKHRTLLLIVQNRFQTETELLSCRLVAHVAAWQHR